MLSVVLENFPSVDKMAVVNAPDADGDPPLAGAIQRGHDHCVAALLAAGARLSDVMPSPLLKCCEAAGTGMYEMVDGLPAAYKPAPGGNYAGVARHLFAAGAQLEARNKAGETPLMLASWGTVDKVGRRDVPSFKLVKFLLECKADINARSTTADVSMEGTALENALLSEQELVAALLIRSGADFRIGGMLGGGALVDACKTGMLPVVEAILGVVDVKEHPEYVCEPLVTACYHGHIDIVKRILQQDDHDDVVCFPGDPFCECTLVDLVCPSHEDGLFDPFTAAAIGGHSDLLKMLLRTRVAPREKQSISDDEFDEMLADTLTCAVIGHRKSQKVAGFVKTGHAGCILALHEVHQIGVPMIRKVICETYPVTGPASLNLRMALRNTKIRLARFKSDCDRDLGPGGIKLASKLFCERCGSCLVRLRRCGGCHEVSYCSTKCQKSDWKKHKKPCKAAKARDTDK